MFERTPVVTIRSSIGCMRLKLWDEETEALVKFPPRKRASLPDPSGRKTLAA